MCCTVYLLHSYNLREINEVQDGGECWSGILLLNTGDWVQ